MFFENSSSSSSEEDLNAVAQRIRQPRRKNENYVEICVANYSNNIFREHFRINRQTSENISRLYSNSIYYFENADGKYGKLDAYHQILTYLWFMGHQTASFRDVADRFDISLSTLFTIIRKASYFISSLSAENIRWPSNDEKEEIQQYFTRNGFPGVIGLIDGSHIKIDKPSEDADSYMNRKHYYSIQIQVVCDHKRKIRDVFIGYPGSVHDSRVFRVSPLAAQLEEKCGENYFILGDSGYPCTRYLLTPYKDRGNLTASQQNYNLMHTRNRYIVEHCFGILKQRCRQLYHVKLRKIAAICHFIRSCCVLHNIALDDNVDDMEMDDNIAENDNIANINILDEDGFIDDRDGVARRNYISEILFNRRN